MKLAMLGGASALGGLHRIAYTASFVELDSNAAAESRTTVLARGTVDSPSMLKSLRRTEQHHIMPYSQNAHNIGIFLLPARSDAVHNRRSCAIKPHEFCRLGAAWIPHVIPVRMCADICMF